MNGSKPLIAVSACLMGEPVRYNGGHTQEKWIVRELSEYVDFYPVCPEMAMGLGTPREEMNLTFEKKDKRNPRLVTKNTKQDLTDQARHTYMEMNRQMQKQCFNGFILMRKSPSCGLSNVTSYCSQDNSYSISTQGLFANFIQNHYPSVPKIDSGRIKNSLLREHFVKCVYAHYRLHQIAPKISALQEFHRMYKYILMEHSQGNLKKLGSLAANHMHRPFEKVFEEYRLLLFQTLASPASISNRYNTMLHIMGYLKKFLTNDDKKSLLTLFDEYKMQLQRYTVPIKLLNFFVKKYNIDYLKDHYYFAPYPIQLKLHNEI